MPVMNGKDAAGPYYRWGSAGKKYYYAPNAPASRKKAKARAARQGRAIKARTG